MRIMTYMQNTIYYMKSKNIPLENSPSGPIPSWLNPQVVQSPAGRIPKLSNPQSISHRRCASTTIKNIAPQAAHVYGLYRWFTWSTCLTSPSWKR